jgi:WD40 repeat protein
MANNNSEQKHPIISILAVIGAMGSFFAALNTIQSQLGLGIPITALLVGLIVSGFFVYRNQIALDMAAITWLGTGLVIIVVYLIASQPATITGQVLRNDGNPASGVTLVLTNSSGVEQRVVTDRDGRFEVSNVPDGRYTITSDNILLYTGIVPSGWQRLVSPLISTGGLIVNNTSVAQNGATTPVTPISTPTFTSTPTSRPSEIPTTAVPTETDTNTPAFTPTLTITISAVPTVIPATTPAPSTATKPATSTEAADLSPREMLLLTRTANAFTSTPTAMPTATETPGPLSSISAGNAGAVMEIHEVLSRHRSTVRTLEFSPDGSLFASGSSDFSAIVWNVEPFNAQFDTRSTHTEWVTGIAFSPDGENVVTAARDGRAIIWDIQAEFQVSTITTSPIRAVDYSPDGSLLAFGLESGVIEIWDAFNGMLLLSMDGHTDRVLDINFNNDGTLLLSGGVDGTIRIWDVLSGSEIQMLSTPSDPQILAVTFSANDELIASASSSGVVRVWNTQTGTRLSAFASATTWDVAFFPGGDLLAIASDNKLVYIWDWKSDATLAELEGHSGAVRSIAVHPDGSMIISGGEEGDNSIRVWGVNGQ